MNAGVAHISGWIGTNLPNKDQAVNTSYHRAGWGQIGLFGRCRWGYLWGNGFHTTARCHGLNANDLIVSGPRMNSFTPARRQGTRAATAQIGTEVASNPRIDYE